MKQALVLVVLLVLTGCTTPKTRSEERPDAFAAMTPAQRKAALGGKVLVGMDRDAVWIAFGKPERIKKDGSRESWIYRRAEFYEVPNWQYRQICRVDGRHHAIPEYDPLQFKRYVDDLEVLFKKGRVVDWKKL